MYLYACSGKFVCNSCLPDDGLTEIIEDHQEEEDCSFCQQAAPAVVVAPMEPIIRHMHKCLSQEFDDAAENLGYCSAEGGYLGTNFTTFELFTDYLELNLPNDKGNELLSVICDSLGDRDWCHEDPYGPRPHEALLYSWERFCKIVKHENRYFFLKREVAEMEALDEVKGPADTLEAISGLCAQLMLFQTWKHGTKFYRVRRQSGDRKLSSAADLGPPPVSAAIQHNRMSPAGIPMFYAALDQRTAMAETIREPGEYCIAEFRLSKNVTVLDLTKLPPIPSIFGSRRSLREPVRFMRRFCRAISEPLLGPELAPIDYVPTQVVTEYFRSAVQFESGAISGIAYPSAQQGGGVAVVLFANQSNVADSPAETDESWVYLHEVKTEVI